MTGEILVLEDLHTYYGKSHVLQGVSFGVGRGEFVALVGRNGVGKSTILKTVMGVTPPRAGRVLLEGREITGRPPHEVSRAGIAWVPEDRRVLPHLTVLENLQISLHGAGVGRHEGQERLQDAFALFPQLRERQHQKGRTLSGGEQQMLALARALVVRPKIMLVDEPTQGLMPKLVAALVQVLCEIHSRGVTVVLVEQMVTVALELARRIYVIDHGVVRLSTTPDGIRQDPGLMQALLGVS
ncbi:MAG: ABC transporter ATP-binding protein [Armatimonadota bacterium]|nr:ABC transporter ATP-binding protein [Armatimonadota bacterium]MDR7485742.1 ABC transporter ATP-binding protein [Armatimonadota bacterium]MDR7537579.1 ABC transporter ATP-binding protein [Armatimonadota bacterium]